MNSDWTHYSGVGTGSTTRNLTISDDPFTDDIKEIVGKSPIRVQSLKQISDR
ncbi:hypothetical protein HanLR1_Chr09g0327621 [Helianthus annuus]|nr:hypothetical protein HanLR1_Chr09g0327621 [Helianthus annuus]